MFWLNLINLILQTYLFELQSNILRAILPIAFLTILQDLSILYLSRLWNH